MGSPKVWWSDFVAVQSLSHVQLFVTLWTTVHQASLSITISKSLLKLMSIQLAMSSNHLILCHPLLLLPSIFPSIRVFSNGCQSTGASAPSSVFPMKIQGWLPLGLTGLISLQSKGLSRVFFNTTVQRHKFSGSQNSPSNNSFTEVSFYCFMDNILSKFKECIGIYENLALHYIKQ